MVAEQIDEAQLERGLRLLATGDDDVLSYLGIQAERLELSDRRKVANLAVPAWSDDDAAAKILSAQRAPADELERYAKKGLAFAQRLLDRAGEQLRGVLCEGKAVRAEIAALKGDARTLIQAVATAVVGALLAAIPTVLAKAVASIATTIAVLLLKKRLEVFCAIGPKAVA